MTDPKCEFEAMYCQPCTANAEIAELRRRCDNLRITRDELAAENAQLEAALKPFADAAAEIPDGLRSTLRIWNGESDDDKYGVIGLSATTDHLLAAARALKAEDGT